MEIQEALQRLSSSYSDPILRMPMELALQLLQEPPPLGRSFTMEQAETHLDWAEDRAQAEFLASLSCIRSYLERRAQERAQAQGNSQPQQPGSKRSRAG